MYKPKCAHQNKHKNSYDFIPLLYQVNQLPLQDQVVILRKQIAKLDEEKRKYQLAEVCVLYINPW